MVQNKLTEQDVRDKASELSFPQSVIEYLQGYIGIPPGGFPEPFRSDVLGDRTLPNGKKSFDGRPGAELDPLDFDRIERELRERYGNINERDVLSYVMYPTVYEEWKEFTSQYGDVSVLPTLPFLRPMEVGEEESFDLEKGKTLYVGLKAISPLRSDGSRDVYFEMNGEPRQVRIHDNVSCNVFAARPCTLSHRGYVMVWNTERYYFRCEKAKGCEIQPQAHRRSHAWRMCWCEGEGRGLCGQGRSLGCSECHENGNGGVSSSQR